MQTYNLTVIFLLKKTSNEVKTKTTRAHSNGIDPVRKGFN
jgi:hypothetical protein